MSNDSIDTSDNSESVSPDDIAPNTNYSRWMTDMAADIAHMKLHQLAIPGAHNSGVDRDGRFHVGMRWAACQYKSFPEQLAAGARYLDLRLVDASYKKDVGGSNAPRYKFVEIFEFAHGGVAVGRHLNHLVEAVNNFSRSNPGEIIFIDFHHYDRGRNHAHNSLERCLRIFSPIKDRLIPPSARDLSIGEIRQQHPGCNVILCLAHDYPVPNDDKPDKWPGGTVRREQIWTPLRHEWNSNDASESGITSLVTNAMKSPPQDNYWVLSAAVTEQTFPKDLVATSPVRTEVFKPGFQNVKILMVDFIEGNNARTSVVDRCITLNRLRSVDKTKPSAPTNLVVTAKDEDTTGGKFQNTLVFNWTPSNDNLGVRQYELHSDGEHFATTNRIPYEHKNFALKNYTFKIKAIDNMNNQSDFSENFRLIQDEIPPTIPGGLFPIPLSNGISALIIWDDSTDTAGVEGYDVYINGVFFAFVPYTQERGARVNTNNDLINNEQYQIKVRAKDINGLYSEFAEKTLYPRPRVINPKYSITGYDESTRKYSVNIVWETDVNDTFPAVDIEYQSRTKSDSGRTSEIYYPESAEGPIFNILLSPNERVNHQCITVFARLYPVSNWIIFDFVFDATPPEEIINLKVTSRTKSSTSISWTPSPDANVKNYAISVNEECPVLVSKSTDTYTFDELPMDETFLIEVWALNDVDACSTIVSLTLEAIDIEPPSKPGTPVITQDTGTSATLSWTPSTDNIGVTAYEVKLDSNAPLIVQNNAHTFTALKEGTSYNVRVRAKDAAGNFSEPSSASFVTKYLPPSKPGIPQVSQITHASAELNWAASSGLEVRYNISLNGFLVARTNEPRLTLSHLRSHFDYRVEVRAVNPGGVSEPAITAFKTLLAPPANLRFSHLNGRCRLAWDPVFSKFPSHEVTINGKVFTTGPGRWGYSFKLSDLSPGPAPHRFTFKVRALLDGASSKESLLDKTLADDVPPAQPGAPIASDISDTSVTLTWEPSSDNVGVTGYRVVLNGFLLFNTPNPRYTFTKLTPGAYHYVFVRALDKDGNLSAPSKSTVFKTTGQPPALPPAKPNVSITAETANSLALEWGSLDGGSGVRILLNDEQWRDVLLLPGVTMLNLLPSVEYNISVSVFDVFGQLSEPTVLTHELKDTTPPSTPENLRTTASTSDSVTLSWDASTDDIGVCEYAIYNDQVYFDSTPELNYIVTGLMPGRYSFEVRALDYSGNASEPASISVDIQGDPSNTPHNFRYTQPADQTILEWDAPSEPVEPVEPVTGYRVTLINPDGREFNYNPTAPTMRERLPAKTRYGVRITARSAAGDSAPLVSEFTTK